MKKILIIAYYFPPIAVSSSYRTLGFCRYLGDFGWDVSVISTHYSSVFPPVGNDDGLLDFVPNNVSVNYISDRNPIKRLIDLRNNLLNHKNTNSGGYGERKVNNPRKENAIKKNIFKFLFEFPDKQKFWSKRIANVIKNKLQNEKYDVLFATGKPWSSLVTASKIATQLNLPFVADFQDPWADNPYETFLSNYFSKRNLDLERFVCNNSRKIITTTEAYTKYLQNKYPEFMSKFTTIPMGADLQMIQQIPVKVQNKKNPYLTSKKYIDHFGSVYGNRNPQKFLLSIQQLYSENRISDDICVRFTGNWRVDNKTERLTQHLESLGLVERRKALPHRDCIVEMQKSDILFVLQPESPLQIPGKIFEYFMVGKPILVVGGEGSTYNFINHHKLGLVCANEIQEIKQTIMKICKGTFTNTKTKISQKELFDQKHLANNLARLLDGLIGV